MKLLIFIFFSTLMLTSCQVEDQRETEYYGDIVDGPGGIRLVDPTEHRSGWGKKDCLMCHNAALNIHRNAGTQLDAAAIVEQAKTRGESGYCLTCHSGNGIQ